MPSDNCKEPVVVDRIPSSGADLSQVVFSDPTEVLRTLQAHFKDIQGTDHQGDNGLTLEDLKTYVKLGADPAVQAAANIAAHHYPKFAHLADLGAPDRAGHFYHNDRKGVSRDELGRALDLTNGDTSSSMFDLRRIYGGSALAMSCTFGLATVAAGVALLDIRNNPSAALKGFGVFCSGLAAVTGLSAAENIKQYRNIPGIADAKALQAHQTVANWIKGPQQEIAEEGS